MRSSSDTRLSYFLPCIFVVITTVVKKHAFADDLEIMHADVNRYSLWFVVPKGIATLATHLHGRTKLSTTKTVLAVFQIHHSEHKC